MAPIPERNRDVFFVGAGLSKALGLPNTAELLDGVFALAAKHERWLISEKLPARIEAAFKYFYPDARHKGYRPQVVDFFSSLRTYVDVGAGFAGGFKDAPDLYRSLKFAIAHLLTERVRECDTKLQQGHSYLERMVQPGNIVITSNWDSVIERYAQLHGVPLRYAGSDPNDFVLLKLHGSLDWCATSNRPPKVKSAGHKYPDSDYAILNERLFGSNPYRMALPASTDAESVLRIRALETWSDAWRKITSRASDLHMVTMARGKAGDLGPLLQVWRDAYVALSRARSLEIAGYSLPEDDTEIRTMLRAGIQRGGGPSKVTVRNPAPDVHERMRRYLLSNIVPDYGSI